MWHGVTQPIIKGNVDGRLETLYGENGHFIAYGIKDLCKW